MNILLTHAYTKENKGDAAIVSVLLGQLRTSFPGSSIMIAMFDDEANYTSAEGYKVISSSLYLSLHRFQNRLCNVLYRVYIEGLLLLWALFYRLCGHSFTRVLPGSTRTLARAYLESDLFVPVGGGYLTAKKGIRGNLTLLFTLNPMIIGILLRKPVILHTQSIGPFGTALQGWVTSLVLNKTQLILTREDHTMRTLKMPGVKPHLIIRSVDAAFLFDADKEVQRSDFIEHVEALRSRSLVGITVRKWLQQEGQEHFERAIAQFADRIVQERHVRLLFIPQVTATVHQDDDREVASRIVSLIANKQHVINCTTNYDHYALKKLYGCLDFLVGTRFHSVIFSLTAYVPSIAIEYEYKTSGIMHDLGLSKWVIPIEQVTAGKLYEKFDQLLSEEEAYKAHLQRILPAYVIKAKAAEQHMKAAYERFKRQSSNH